MIKISLRLKLTFMFGRTNTQTNNDVPPPLRDMLCWFFLVQAVIVCLTVIVSSRDKLMEEIDRSPSSAVIIHREKTVEIEKESPKKDDKSSVVSQSGVASWYDYEINGSEWSKSHRTCASRTLKRYSMARVTNLDTGESVDCFVNDYIEHPDRDIDLSSYAFIKIAPLSLGLVNVKIEQL